MVLAGSEGRFSMGCGLGASEPKGADEGESISKNHIYAWPLSKSSTMSISVLRDVDGHVNGKGHAAYRDHAKNTH